jgi:hypothetical protein
MFQPIVQRSYLFEVNLTTISAGQVYNLTVAPQILLDAKVVGLKCFTASDMAKSPNQSTVVSDSGATNISFTLQCGSDQRIFSAAYLDYRPAFNSGAVRTFDPMVINWSKSFVQIYGITGLSAGQSVIFEAIYTL